MPRGTKPMTGWGPEEIKQATALLPFLAAARRGLLMSCWRPGLDADELLAPIVLAVLVEVSKQLRIGELLAEQMEVPGG